MSTIPYYSDTIRASRPRHDMTMDFFDLKLRWFYSPDPLAWHKSYISSEPYAAKHGRCVTEFRAPAYYCERCKHVFLVPLHADDSTEAQIAKALRHGCMEVQP